MLELYTYFRSSAAYRVRIALNIKGLEAKKTVVWLTKGEQASDSYRELNPQSLVPTLVDGDVKLAQSLAIMEYLDETKDGPKLLPAEPLARAQVRSLSLLVACDIHPLNNLRILKYLKGELALDQEAVDTWYRHWCDTGLSAYERELAQCAGQFSVGDTVSMADICLVPQVFNANRFHVDMSQYPLVTKINDACLALPAFQKAQPGEQVEAQQ